jgi:uncharacterized OB-fold protein
MRKMRKDTCAGAFILPPLLRGSKQLYRGSQEGAIVAWALTEYEYFGMPTKPPFIGALIRLDGTDSNFLHLIGGIDLSDSELVRKQFRTA